MAAKKDHFLLFSSIPVLILIPVPLNVCCNEYIGKKYRWTFAATNIIGNLYTTVERLLQRILLVTGTGTVEGLLQRIGVLKKYDSCSGCYRVRHWHCCDEPNANEPIQQQGFSLKRGLTAVLLTVHKWRVHERHWHQSQWLSCRKKIAFVLQHLLNYCTFC
jgi:hypothetical protein